MASSYDQVSRVSESKSLMEDNSTPSATASPVAKPVTAEKPAEASTPVATPVPVAVPVAAAVPSSERSALLPASSSDTAITKFKQMEIERINGYLRLVNLVMGLALGWLGLYHFYHLNSYKGFMSSLFITVQALLIVLFELRENFPNASKIVHDYLGFMYTAYGRGALFFVIGTWCPTQGPYGVAVGVCFIILALLNFFIILQHPGYKNAMSVRHIRIEEGEEDDEVPHYGTTPEKAV
ncbi:hypothetical protein H257_04831 [Aphanomyces astaci]|uniref:Golgi apparatus membrane protein TVP15 n=2 Tax=Aphanomyces astaci TaxID=112090 RepID=W4GW31_APHAT|nr:hypothetical protein H257_04831 [Aphanomyces astaci]ETV83103.1 hypothetical protein H257_04831 [Aphanomyces astaci]|eukprot:XP_009827774.1 hypothetical protein H257_04831 [Aphanomyces astaci]